MSAGSVGPRFFTADDVLRVAAAGMTALVVSPRDRLTPMARDTARDKGVAIVVQEGAAPSAPARAAYPPIDWPPRAPRLVHVADVARMPLGPFPAPIDRPAMDERLRDVVGADDGLPMAAGVLSLRAGSFPWHLDYDEIEYVLEGVLEITAGQEKVVGQPGDIIAIPKGTSITFGTPSWAKFLYVTYPANWNG